jgi:hypothetical protein
MADKSSTDAILFPAPLPKGTTPGAHNLGWGRISFPFVFERAKDKVSKQDTKYEVCLLCPPGTDFAPLRAILLDAMERRFGKDQKKWPTGPNARRPEDVIRPCEERPKHFGDFPGWHFISARTDYAPLVRDQTKEPVYEQDGKRRFPRVTAEQADLVYAGRWARLAVNAYAFTTIKQGVSLGLEGVWLGKNDTRLAGGGSRADSVADNLDDLAQEMEEETALD